MIRTFTVGSLAADLTATVFTLAEAGPSHSAWLAAAAGASIFVSMLWVLRGVLAPRASAAEIPVA